MTDMDRLGRGPDEDYHRNLNVDDLMRRCRTYEKLQLPSAVRIDEICLWQLGLRFDLAAKSLATYNVSKYNTDVKLIEVSVM